MGLMTAGLALEFGLALAIGPAAMTPGQKLQKVFELSELGKSLFRAGLRQRFPEATEEELHRIFLNRIEKCHNRNY
jgi:hypothetical protein